MDDRKSLARTTNTQHTAEENKSGNSKEPTTVNRYYCYHISCCLCFDPGVLCSVGRASVRPEDEFLD